MKYLRNQYVTGIVWLLDKGSAGEATDIKGDVCLGTASQ